MIDNPRVNSVVSVNVENGALNGAVYLTRWHLLLNTKYILSRPVKVYSMPSDCSVDIDTNEDWLKAEEIFND